MEDHLSMRGHAMQEGELNPEQLKKPGIAAIGVLYSLVALLFMFIGSRVQQNEFYSGVLITEFVLLLLPPLFYLVFFRFDLKKVARLNKIGFLQIFIIIWAMVFSIPIVGVFNLANLWVVKLLFGKTAVVLPPVPGDALGLLLSILVIAVSPGICEEFLFRGVIQRGFERFGAAKSILLAAFLFGLIHFDFQKLLGTFMLGGLIGFIVYRTNSLFGGMVAHFANNATAVLASYGSQKLMDMVKSSGLGNIYGRNDSGDVFSAFAGMSNAQLIATAVVWAFIFLFCAAVVTGLIVALYTTTSGKTEGVKAEMGILKRPGILWFIPGLLIIGFIYFAQGAGLLGANASLVEFVRELVR